MTAVTFDSVELDMEIPPVVRKIDQRFITRNAAASLDYNPIHTNPAWAAEVNLLGKGTTIAHGMCTCSFMVSAVTDWCYASGGFLTGLESKFIHPVRPGDTVTCRGIVTEKHPRRKSSSFVVVELTAETQDGTAVAVAKIKLLLP